MNIIEATNIKNYIGGNWVHDDLNFSVEKGEIVAIVGGSGSGKTTLLRNILMLLKPTAGSVKVFGKDVTTCTEAEANSIRRRWGVMFQHSALFSSLTVLENVLFPIQEFTKLPPQLQKEIALLKITMAGLPIDSATKYPAELSGGMQKRAALARAIALDPELLFFDEPTSGLDPKSAAAFDELMLDLRNSLGITMVMITHDVDSLHRVTDKVAFLAEGKVVASEPIEQLVQNPHPRVQEYFASLTR